MSLQGVQAHGNAPLQQPLDATQHKSPVSKPSQPDPGTQADDLERQPAAVYIPAEKHKPTGLYALTRDSEGTPKLAFDAPIRAASPTQTISPMQPTTSTRTTSPMLAATPAQPAPMQAIASAQTADPAGVATPTSAATAVEATPTSASATPTKAAAPEQPTKQDEPTSAKPTKDEPATKTSSATANTDKVDREIEQLREKQKQIAQQLRAATDPEKAEQLKKESQRIQNELRLKDNDAYRRANTIFTT